MSDNTDIGQYRRKKPKNVAQIVALEFYNPAFGIYRFVGPVAFKDKDLGIETGAPRNAGETVTHRAISFEAPFPAQLDEPKITIPITIERIGSELKTALKQITGFSGFTPTEVIWRLYLSSDLTAPKTVFYLYSESVSLNARAVTINASERNPLTSRVCDIATTQRFPGLIDL